MWDNGHFNLNWLHSHLLRFILYWLQANAKANLFLWFWSLINANIKLDSLWTHHKGRHFRFHVNIKEPYPANVAGLLYERGLRLSGKLKEDTLLCGCTLCTRHKVMETCTPRLHSSFFFLSVYVCVCVSDGANQISNFWIQFRVTSSQDVQRNSAWLIPKR